jgi:hypothetical protein
MVDMVGGSTGECNGKQIFILQGFRVNEDPHSIRYEI